MFISSSQTVSITADGQSESVELSYALWLVQNSTDVTTNTGGMNRLSASANSSTLTQRYGYTGNKLDLSEYTTLTVHYKILNKYRVKIGISNTKYTDSTDLGIASYLAALDITTKYNSLTEKTSNIDISKIANGYFGFGVRGDSTNPASLQIIDAYCSK